MPKLKLDAAHNRVARAPAAAVLAAGAAARLPVFRLDGALLGEKQGLLKELAQVLALPRHFGQNWDALADCLMDRDWLPPAGCVLLWTSAQTFATAAAEDYATAQDVFAEAAAFWKEHGRPFHVFLD